MRAVVCSDGGGVEVLEVVDRDDLEPGPGEVRIDVVATAVNRADVMQRMGFYPPPPGESDVLGLECAGTIGALGEGVDGWSVGDRVCALLGSGGYAEQVVVPAGQLLAVPPNVSWAEAASLPEVVSTVWSNVFMAAGLQPGELFLVHGGSGGIGSIAIQMAHALGAKVACTVGTAEKAVYCRDLGADLVVNYREQDFVEEVKAYAKTLDKRGADVILDNMGAKYLPRNVDALGVEGRLVVIGMQGGRKGELDLGKLLTKRAAVIATSLRARPAEAKAAIVTSVREHVWPLVADGTVRSVVHTTLPLDDVRAAHELMESSEHRGKIVLTVRDA